MRNTIKITAYENAKTKKDKDYCKYESSLGKLNCFDWRANDTIKEAIASGYKHFEVEVEENNGFRNIKEVYNTVTTSAVEPTEITDQYEKSAKAPVKVDSAFRTPVQLTRIDCLKAAVRHLQGLNELSETAVTDLADMFVKWVNVE